jgi:CHAT domain-containing protein/tetratricopeptide (TPR) repeat protein
VAVTAVAAVFAAAAAPASPPVTLVPGRDVRLNLEGDQGVTTIVHLREGQACAVRILRQESPVALALSDPAGAQRRLWIRDPADARGSDCTRPARADAAWVADKPGDWTVRVLPPAGAGPVGVTLRAETPRAATPADRLGWEADRLDAEVGAQLDGGHADEAVAMAPRLVEARERQDGDDRLALASDLGYLGVRFFGAAACRAGAWDLAETLVRRALALRAAALPEGDLCVAESRSLVASILYAEGGYEEGEELEKRSLAARLARGPTAAAQAQRGRRDVGLLLMKEGKYSEAEQYLTATLDSIESDPAPDPAARADALHTLGELLRSQNRYPEAAARFAAARASLEGAAAPDAGLLADITSSLAGLHLDRAEYDDAEHEARRFLDLLDAHPEAATPERRVIGRNNLGEIYRRQGRLEDAQPILTEALDAAREALCPDNPTLLFFRINLAMLLAERGQAARAEALYRESLRATEAALGPSHPSVAQSLHDLAGFLASTGRAAEAVALGDRALLIREEIFGPDHPLTAATRLARARARLDRGDPPAEVLPEVERARAALAASAVDPESEVEAETLASDLMRRLGRRDEAVAMLERALEGVERLRPRRGGGETARADFLRRHLGDYDRRIAWAVEDGDDAGAFVWAERSRARSLLDLLTVGTGDLRASVPPAERPALEERASKAASALAEAQARAEYERTRRDRSPEERRRVRAEIEAAVDAAARAVRLTEDDVRAHSPLWRDAVTSEGGAVGVEEARRGAVPRGGWLLEYRIGPGGAWLFALPAENGPLEVVPLRLDQESAARLRVSPGPVTADLLDAILAGDVKTRVPSLLRSLAAPPSTAGDEGETIAALAALREAILPAAIWRHLRRASEVVLVADGPLLSLPFEALVIRPARSWNDARLWIDEGPVIRYAASATSLVNLERRAAEVRHPAARQRETPWVLSVSDPDYGGRFPPLPGTARESAAIAEAFRSAGLPGAVQVLEGSTATEPAVIAALAGRRYIHFATHGLVDPRRSDLLAGLALTASPPAPVDGATPGPGAASAAAAAPSSGTDGLLQLYEIDSLRIDADLVVLSACDSGIGRRSEGEGLMSLARGFFAAGGRRVVATLWPVSDASTVTLVGDLFRSVAEDEAAGRDLRSASALRDAKRLLRRRSETADPFYWAPFILSGMP